LQTLLEKLEEHTEPFSSEDYENRCAALVREADEQFGIIAKFTSEIADGCPFETGFGEQIRKAVATEGLTYIGAFEVYEAGGGEQVIVHALCLERNEFFVITPSGEVGLYRSRALAQLPEDTLGKILELEETSEEFKLQRGFRLPSTFGDWVTGYDELAMQMNQR